MKKAFLFLSLGALLAACSSGSEKKAKEEYTLAGSEETIATDSTTGANVTAVAHQPQIDTSATKIGTGPTGGAVAKGAKLIEGSDCMGCHRENEKLLGPAYQAVAEKYPSNDANVQMLAGKIIKGGKGNWGDVAMTPHPGLSEADAQEMARYILSLR
ncbi:c-type cytochrome [Hymenobacter metallicola]|uniref:C-type cytochrome n=1 Tax=Hymenobacter metallicola TaxID=2563114 RepID=A0A4Z0QFW6_9BACT|nr:c-type cytochrome [Hymenobacter metallicola]TGE28938.1 c-type cytochrome [Hymenobacter metallicola]